MKKEEYQEMFNKTEKFVYNTRYDEIKANFIERELLLEVESLKYSTRLSGLNVI
jgi:hypothetical protein